MQWKLILREITVWKFTEFFVSQILRQITFEEFKSCKTAIVANFGVLNFVGLVTFNFQKVKNSEPLNVLEWKISILKHTVPATQFLREINSKYFGA